ncbi:uncharacterized protein LOC117333197 isoform X2 [Pecten maximus]|uniref:uncharacterized protein LOC117333197 isoform X2 n=1 Tax=Pecten maximus TaxID=6579 RepID=UPI001458659C|nr:uncharacterized protein LOC117333197 isoform X2 [Pecten maximus]
MPEDIYGEYVHEIREGQRKNSCDDRDDAVGLQSTASATTDSTTLARDRDDESDTPTPAVQNINSVIIGASNCRRLDIPNDSKVVNDSISGATFNNIEANITTAKMSLGENDVDKIIISLGTNDITKHRTDGDSVTINIMHALDKVKDPFPGKQIGLCSVIPRKGKSPSIQAINATAVTVNSFMAKLCVLDKSRTLSYIDTVNAFIRKGVPICGQYDSSEASGMHISVDGAHKLWSIMEDFIMAPHTTVNPWSTPKTSRKRVLSSETPPGRQTSK